MKLHLSKPWLVAVFVLLMLPFVSGANAATIDIFQPADNQLFTQSINIPLEYNISNATSCNWILSYRGYTINRTSICDYVNTKIDLDYDTNYTLLVVGDLDNQTITFTVDRGNISADAMLSLGLLAFFLLLAIFFGGSAFAVNEQNWPLKMGFFLLSLFLALFSLEIGMTITREYLKQGNIIDSLNTFHFVFAGVLMFMIIYFLATIIKNVLAKIPGSDLSEFGDEDEVL